MFIDWYKENWVFYFEKYKNLMIYKEKQCKLRLEFPTDSSGKLVTGYWAISSWNML